MTKLSRLISYLNGIINEKLDVQVLGRGYAGLDTGMHQAMMEASKYIEIIERRQRRKIVIIQKVTRCKVLTTDRVLLNKADELNKKMPLVNT